MARPRIDMAFVAAVALLLGASVALPAYLSYAKIRLQKRPIYPPNNLQLRTLPRAVPGWAQRGEDEVLSKEAAEELGTFNYLTRTYVQTGIEPPDEPARLDVHMAYYTGMIDTVPHVPERCFVAAGVNLVGASQTVKVPLDLSRLIVDPDSDKDPPILLGRGSEVQNRFRLPYRVEDLALRVSQYEDPSGGRVLAGYFFIANGTVVSSADEVRLQAFRLQADYAYYAKMQFMSASVDTPEELAVLVGGLLDELLPEVMRRMPDWIEVERGNVSEHEGS
ncbi:MAG: exosortase-associated EpsI family protein [Phycisphaerales bacterium]|nr:exosortase-associated EpsI family protein [Phycisphaerales bacterium]